MAFTAEILIKLADVAGILVGDPQQTIFDVRPYTEGETDKTTLFVAAQDCPVPTDSKVAVYIVDREQADAVLNRMHNQLVRDYRRKAALARLLECDTEMLDIHDLAALLYEVMENPAWILTAQQEVVAFSGEIAKNVNLQNLNRHFQNAPVDRICFVEPDEKCCYRRAVGQIHRSNEVIGYFVVIESENPLLDRIDTQYMQQLCSLLSKEFKLSEYTRFTQDEWLVQNLLRGQLSKPEIIEERMRQIHWKKHEKTYILAIDIQTCNSDKQKTLPWQIGSILNCKLYRYRHYLIAVIGCSYDVTISEYSYPDLLSFLEKENLFAGLSNGFIDFSLFKAYFDQCVAAIHHRVRLMSLHPEVIRFARYEDVVLTDLIEKAEQQGIPPITLCHPIVLRIIEYDKANNTEYLNTLSAYISMNNSLQGAAEVLHIHRNTMYNRVIKLKEYFMIDFDNTRLFMKLRISTTVCHYLGILNMYSHMGRLD